MAREQVWATCRVGYVEVSRALRLAGGAAAVRTFAREWPAIAVVEIDQTLCERATELAAEHDLRSVDALHLASALLVDDGALALATWDRRLHAAAGAAGLALMPDSL